MSLGNVAILIAGAGPVGLTAALELARHGYTPVIIDEKPHPSDYSKAIGINSRTLELLEPSGVTERLLANGEKITLINFLKQDSVIFTLNFSRINHRFNFMLALPQSCTERIIESRLNELGIYVKRETKLTGFNQDNNKVSVTMLKKNNQTVNSYDYVLGTDGAHSTVRRELNIQFPGTSIPGDWSLADVKMDNPFENSANVILNKGGFVLMLEFKKGLFRLASNRPDVINFLTKDSKINEVIWKSDFSVSHRQASTYNIGRIYLGGDSAHIHSPLGARGMNMGIEDVCTWVNMFLKTRLDEYSDKRHRAGLNVIKLVETQTFLITNTNPIIRFLFTKTMIILLKSEIVHRFIVTRMAGLN